MVEESSAVWNGHQGRSYTAMVHDLESTTRWIEAQNNHPTEPIGLVIDSHYWAWMTLLAHLRLGLAAAPVMRGKLAEAEASGVFKHWLTNDQTTAPATARVLDIPAISASTRKVMAEKPEQKYSRLEFHIADTARMWFMSSGTTGRPKLMEVDADQLRARVKHTVAFYEPVLTPQSRVVSLMRMDSIGGFMLNLCAWMKGASLAFGYYQQNTPKFKITLDWSDVLLAAPAQLKDLLDKFPEPWPNRQQRQIRVGGANMSQPLLKRALAIAGDHVSSTYASTETGLIATCSSSDLLATPAAAGHLLEGAEVDVVDDKGNVIPDGQVGLIRCRAPGMATGYVGQQDQETFKDGWFYSGDMGCMRSDGLLEIHGRRSDVLNLGGVKVAATHMEGLIEGLDHFYDACVVPVQFNDQPAVAVAAVVDPSVPHSQLAQSLQRVLRLRLPIRLVLCKTIERNTMGKIDRPAMAAYVERRLQTHDAANSAPADGKAIETHNE